MADSDDNGRGSKLSNSDGLFYGIDIGLGDGWLDGLRQGPFSGYFEGNGNGDRDDKALDTDHKAMDCDGIKTKIIVSKTPPQ